jgi:putative transposase
VQRDFSAIAPDQKWFGDITYIRTWQGWLYLAVILDAYGGKVVGWARPIACAPSWPRLRSRWR